MSISNEEQQRIIALASGTMPPETGMEKHFVMVLGGKGRACSPKEKEWVAYWSSHATDSVSCDQVSEQSTPENTLEPDADTQALPVGNPVVPPVATDCLGEFDTPPDLAFEDEVVHEEASQLLEALLNKRPSEQTVAQQLVRINELLQTAHASTPPRIAKRLEAAEALLAPF